MKKLTILFALLLSIVGAKANDGVFYAQGNHLIPIAETDISVKKEVLTINRVGDHLEVTVYYEFFNPTKPKDLLVGFEAASPYPAFDHDMDLFPEQPHIRNFKVLLNGERLPYEIAHVDGNYYDSPEERVKPKYYVNSKVQGMTRKQCFDAMKEEEADIYPFYFVYHFNAHFREGLNTIMHTYDFDMSNTVEEEFTFNYILTAANRWANNGIDDFTLEVNMGERESFEVEPRFFKDDKDWIINGKGRVSWDEGWIEGDKKSVPVFHIYDGSITYKKKNFHPEDELCIKKKFYMLHLFADSYDGVDGEYLLNLMKKQYNSLGAGFFENFDLSDITSEQKRVMKNMPFAYRGHVFKDKGLKQYFESTDWYIPNPDYVDDMEKLSQDEKEWVQYWSK